MKNKSGHERVLLISNSTLYGSGYLDHAEGEIRSFLRGLRSVLFIPYALYDRDTYASMVQKRFERMGFALESIHTAVAPRLAVDIAESIFVGGGNTFRLLKALYDSDTLNAIRERVKNGMPYIGSSAGSNVAGPTIKTTKDPKRLGLPTIQGVIVLPDAANGYPLAIMDSTEITALTELSA